MDARVDEGRNPARVPSVPGRRHYVVGSAILIVGVGLFAFFLLRAVNDYTPHIRAVVPGTYDIDLGHAGKYTVFYEYRSVVDGRVYSTGETLSEILVRIRRDRQSEPLELVKPASRTSYDHGERAGGSMLEFRIEEPGTYEFTAIYSTGIGVDPNVVLAIGRFSLFREVFRVLSLLVGGVLIGGFIVVRAFVRRRSAAAGLDGSVAPPAG